MPTEKRIITFTEKDIPQPTDDNDLTLLHSYRLKDSHNTDLSLKSLSMYVSWLDMFYFYPTLVINGKPIDSHIISACISSSRRDTTTTFDFNHDEFRKHVQFISTDIVEFSFYLRDRNKPDPENNDAGGPSGSFPTWALKVVLECELSS